jgi:hypothetical protein
MVMRISYPVGAGGSNQPGDVRTVQTLLNAVPAGAGGPAKPLVADGMIGPLTKSAISRFQLAQFRWADLRVDPDGPTLVRLNVVTGQPGAASMVVRLPTPPRPAQATPSASPPTPPGSPPAPAVRIGKTEVYRITNALLTDVHGDVRVRQPGAGWVDAANGMVLRDNANVSVMDGSAVVSFSDGTHVVLGPESLFVLYSTKIKLPGSAAPPEVTVDPAELRRALDALRGG